MSIVEYNVSDGVCVLRLNRPPVNAIDFALLDELRAAVARANADGQVRGIVITGGRDRFSAGADVELLGSAACDADAIRTSRLFQEALQQVEDSPKPVAAAVAGKAMGSAVELAAACHFRLCTPPARFSMPEVKLGINPGAGGTQRLPRLIGAGPALKMLLTAETVGAARAAELGLVDAVCDPEDLLDKAKEMLRSGAEPRRTGRRTDKVHDPAAIEAAFREAEDLLAGVRPEIIAPRKIAEAVRTGLCESPAAGLAAEQRAFAACMATAAARNKIYVFLATREMARAPEVEGAPRPVPSRAAVVGMGSMGTGIVQALAAGGLAVIVCDADPAALDRGMDRIRRSLARRVAKGKLRLQSRCNGIGDLLAEPEAAATLARITPTTDWRDLARAEIVVEAVYEDLPTKQSVFRRIEDVCPPDTIVASNTSMFSLDVLAESMRRPENLVGLHFFNPAHSMPLVEVVRRDATAGAVVAAVMALAKAVGKTPVLVRNREGFLVNRIFVPYLKEAFRLVEDGAAPADVDRAMVEFGFPMGPLALIDMAGLDILVHVDAVMARAFAAHGTVSPIAVRLVEGGCVGQKAGAGVYRYEGSDHVPHPSDRTDRIIAEVRRELHRPVRAVGAEEITDRLVLRMVNEALCVLAEGLARRESDIDAAMVLGTGFPDFRGGVVRYARQRGPARVAARLDELAKTFGQGFRPCEFLRQMKGAR